MIGQICKPQHNFKSNPISFAKYDLNNAIHNVYSVDWLRGGISYLSFLFVPFRTTLNGYYSFQKQRMSLILVSL